VTVPPSTLLCAVPSDDDAPPAAVTVNGRSWTITLVAGVVFVGDDGDAPFMRLLHAWIPEGATLADVVELALVEAAPRAPVLADVAGALLAGRTLVTPQVTCGRIVHATDPTPRWGCYRDPGGVLITGEHVVPGVIINEQWGGFEISHTVEDDASPFGAALAFVREVGVTGARAALASVLSPARAS